MTLLSKVKSKLSGSDPEDKLEPSSKHDEVIGVHYDSRSSSFDGFVATSKLQVQAIGYDTNQALTGRTLENISVDRLETGQTEYVSVRQKKSSNSCALVRASDPNQTCLISTIYRWGPGRHPRMHILPHGANISAADAIKDDDVPGETVDVKSRSLVSRAQEFNTAFGEFEWRYGTKEEKSACDADSLLIMERMDRVLLPNGEKNKSGVQVAQLIRNDQFRTAGTKRYSGGNGGLLAMDLRMWDREKGATSQSVEAFIVASSILMLKREADRFIDNNVAAVV